MRAKGQGTTARQTRVVVDDQKQAFNRHVRQHGLKATRQRDRIVEVFLRSEGHLSIDDLLERVRRADPRISAATVYRTVKLLEEAGLADKLHFQGRSTRYEATSADHHDHLICTQCGRIDEFENERIEALQDQVASSFGYEIVSHRHEIYGVCPSCRVGGRRTSSARRQNK